MRCVISSVYMSCLPRYQGNSSLSQKHRTGLRPPVPYMRTKWTTRRSGGPIVCLGSYLHPHDLNPGYAVKQSRKIAECHNNNKIDLYFIPEKHRKPARKNSKVKRVKLELYTYESDWWFVYIRLASHPSASQYLLVWNISVRSTHLELNFGLSRVTQGYNCWAYLTISGIECIIWRDQTLSHVDLRLRASTAINGLPKMSVYPISLTSLSSIRPYNLHFLPPPFSYILHNPFILPILRL